MSQKPILDKDCAGSAGNTKSAYKKKLVNNHMSAKVFIFAAGITSLQ